MEEQIKPFSQYHTRKGFNSEKRKKELILENNYCNMCKKTYTSLVYQLDHIVPVYLFGSVKNKNNHQLLCKSCHSKKTGIDISIISCFKKMYLIGGTRFDTCTFLKKEEIINLYLKLYPLYSFSKKRFDEW